MAYELKHNLSIVVIPNGHDRNSLKKFVRLHKSLREDERNLLIWVLDQAQTYTLTVKQIREEMQWGELRWTKTRASLSDKEILKQTKTPLDRKSHSWSLHFDFVAVVARPQLLALSPVENRASRARVIPDYGRVSHDPRSESAIVPEPLTLSGLSTQVELEPTPKQQNAKESDDENSVQKEEHFVYRNLLPLGLKKGVTSQLFTILIVAGIEDFLVEFGSARPFARNESGLAISIARRAASGFYTQTRIESSGPTPTAICEKYKNRSGNLMGPNGLVAVASGFDAGQLRMDATFNAKTKPGLLLSLVDSAKLWRRLEAAELDFVHTAKNI